MEIGTGGIRAKWPLRPRGGVMGPQFYAFVSCSTDAGTINTINVLAFPSRPDAMQFLYNVVLDTLLFCATWAALFALFGSAIIGTFWALGRALDALLTPPSVRKRRRETAAGFNPNHLKRAGHNIGHGP